MNLQVTALNEMKYYIHKTRLKQRFYEPLSVEIEALNYAF
jgi:hypothetical protein